MIGGKDLIAETPADDIEGESGKRFPTFLRRSSPGRARIFVRLKFRAAVSFVLRDAPQNAYLNLGGNFRAALMHLTEAQVAIIRAWAAATPHVDAVRLFGSYARGLAHERSDIDLAVSGWPLRRPC